MSFWDDWLDDLIDDGRKRVGGVITGDPPKKPPSLPPTQIPPAPPSTDYPPDAGWQKKPQAMNWQAVGVIVGVVSVLLTIVLALRRK